MAVGWGTLELALGLTPEKETALLLLRTLWSLPLSPFQAMELSSVVDADAVVDAHMHAMPPVRSHASAQRHSLHVLRVMQARQQQRRASITFLPKQRSHETPRETHASGAHTFRTESTSPVANRTAPLPKLLPPTEEQHKIARYEQMMTRFQLRRMPFARTASSKSERLIFTTGTRSTNHEGGTPTEPRSQPLTHRSWMDFTSSFAPAGDVVAAADANINGAIRGSPMSGCSAETPVDDGAPEASVQQPTIDQCSIHSFRPIINDGCVVFGTFDPAGVPMRLWLLMLVMLFTSQLVYMPYAIVYHTHHSAAVVLDSVTNTMFLLNVLVTCNTATQTTRGKLITSRRAIWRHYRRNGFLVDVLAAAPFAIITHCIENAPLLRWLLCILQLALQGTSVRRHICMCHAIWKRDVTHTDKSVLAWLLYSRYSHLVRIGGIVLMITLMAHYFACVWSLLLADVDDGFLTSTGGSIVIHLHSFYDVLQLLQGQGLPTSTPAQDLFGSFAVLLGSIVFAVVFGHVAILVSNFNANHTSYQRKLERVFAIMSKLQLPHPIRERVHQYYEYLHAEYESLDGEVVKFAKELSHTLELEVVLFKYMDVVMHVPHWHECSPDFQKQLALNLSVRVYLPDDFIMREGEVGTECYIISRGTCKQHAYGTGNYEPPTMATMSDNIIVPQAGSSSRMPSHTPGAAVIPIRALPRGRSRYSLGSSGRSEGDVMDAGPNTSVAVLKRGQAVGAMSLLYNYPRSSDLRAATYVEMCVIERETFQRILTRYPRDREIVLDSIVHHTMLHVAAERMPCMFMRMVREVVPTASVSTGIRLVVKAMNPCENDPTIVFGVTEQLRSRIQEISAREEEATNVKIVGRAPSTTVPLSKHDPETTPRRSRKYQSGRRKSIPAIVSQSADMALFRLVSKIHERLARLEERDDTCCKCHNEHQELTTTSPPIVPPPKPRPLPRISPPTSLRSLQRRGSENPFASLSQSRLIGTDGHFPTRSVSKRLLAGLVGTLWTRPTVIGQSPSPWADQLYRSNRHIGAHNALVRPPHLRVGRHQLRRTHST